jgi:hypothetical protein
MRFSHLCPQVGGCPQASAGYRPLAYASPEDVQPTGIVAVVAYIEIAVGCRVMKRPATPSTEPIEIQDEPGMEERFKRALRKALNTPLKHRAAPTPKTKERPASEGRGGTRITSIASARGDQAINLSYYRIRIAENARWLISISLIRR